MAGPKKYKLHAPAEPPFPHILVLRHLAKTADELYGVLRGIMAGGAADAQDIRFLTDYLKRHPCGARWPYSDILIEIAQFESWHEPSATDCAKITNVLKSILGHGDVGNGFGRPGPTTLPLDDPPTGIVFQDAAFCITGKFSFGERRHVEEAISARGGCLHDHVTPTTAFLVVGSFTSTGWRHLSFGSKIEEAVAQRAAGSGIKIIAEVHWQSYVDQTPPLPMKAGVIINFTHEAP